MIKYYSHRSLQIRRWCLVSGTSLGALILGLVVTVVGAYFVQARNVILNILGVLLLLGGLLNLLGAIPLVPTAWISIILAVVAIAVGAALIRDGGRANILKTVLGLVVFIVGLYALLSRLNFNLFGIDFGDILQDGINAWRRLWNSAEAGYKKTS
jgi:hypothetical protein